MPESLMYVICWVWCYICCGYFATAFVLLSFENFHQVYASMYYVGHIVLAAAIIISLGLMPSSKKTRIEVSDKAKSE